MAADANVFNFDVSPFVAGIKRIDEGLGHIESNAKKFGATITNSVGKAVNGAILKVGALIAAFKGMGAVLKEMPEVGQAFGIAKDVFLKNLLWPLRQQVMPMLQNMLDWVRDNRARFVQWGVAVANVFRAVVVSARVLWDVMKSLLDTVGNAFQRAFNTNFKSFDEFVNVLSFKVAAVIVYFGMLAKSLIKDFSPAFDWIIDMGGSIIDFFVQLGTAWGTANKNGDSLWTVFSKIKDIAVLLGGALKAAWEGFKEGFLSSEITDAMTPLRSLAESFERILKAIGFGDTDGVRGAFKALGSFLGTAFMATLVTIAGILEGIANAFEDIAAAGEAIKKLFSGDLKGAGAAGTRFLEGTSRGGTKSVDDAYSIFTGESINDGIVTKTGRVIKTSPDDNIFAAKDFSAYNRGIDSAKDFQIQDHSKNMTMGPVSVGPFYVTVTEGDAEQAGKNFGTGLGYSFRDNVSRSLRAEGN